MNIIYQTEHIAYEELTDIETYAIITEKYVRVTEEYFQELCIEISESDVYFDKTECVIFKYYVCISVSDRFKFVSIPIVLINYVDIDTFLFLKGWTLFDNNDNIKEYKTD